VLFRSEIRRADDWGLAASAFEIPKLNPHKLSLQTLADAEITLSLAVLKYARHARGGRLDPALLSPDFDVKPPLLDPKRVLVGISRGDAPDAYLRSLHPKHPQFKLLREALLQARGRTSFGE
jgi:murein L,D-transpeptidase YcbB/YkuD